MAYKQYPQVYITINEQTILMKNSYGWYTAEYIQTMNIPRCDSDTTRKSNYDGIEFYNSRRESTIIQY